MPEPTEPLALEATALRYAARSLPAAESTAFEARLATDQTARDALSEAVRLSAAALDETAPGPNRGFRRAVRSRMVSRLSPIAWAGIGAGTVAAATLFAVQLADRPAPAAVVVSKPISAPAMAPEPRPISMPVAKADEPEAPTENPEDMRKAAEIWAELSTPEHVEKTHDDEAKLQQRFKNLRPGAGLDSREP